MPLSPDPRWRVVPRLTRFWADDRGLSAFSVFLVVLAFVLPPLVPAGTGRSAVGDLVYFALLLSGVHALGERRLVRVVLMPVAVITMAADLASWFVPVPRPWGLAMGLLSLLHRAVQVGIEPGLRRSVSDGSSPKQSLQARENSPKCQKPQSSATAETEVPGGPPAPRSRLRLHVAAIATAVAALRPGELQEWSFPG